MSRIGNKAITVPAGVEVTIAQGNEVTVKGPKGTLTRIFDSAMEISLDDGILTVKRPNDEKRSKQLHGTTRAVLNNMIVGVHEGYKKQLEIVGIGYRSALNGNTLTLQVGYSKPVEFEVPEGLTVSVEKNTQIAIEGIDKQLVGDFAANVRATRKPEPYLGKGIRYKGELVRRKEGKTAASKK